MGKHTDLGLLPPDHPIYSEGPQSYSPHWAQGLVKSTTATRETTAGPKGRKGGSGKSQPTKTSS